MAEWERVSGSEWFQLARDVFRVAGGGEGGSFPEAGREEGERFPIETISGRHVYFIGATGETSLTKVQVEALQDDSAGTVLRICAGLWKEFRLAQTNSTLYAKAYYLMRGRDDFSLVWSSTSVVLACDDAKKRQQVIPRCGNRRPASNHSQNPRRLLILTWSTTRGRRELPQTPN